MEAHPEHPFSGRRVAFLGAHPDDESFTAGGTLAAAAASGGTVDLAVATCGERGRAYVDASLTDDELKAVRRAELGEAAAAIGAREVAVLGLPDAGLGAHVDDLAAWYAALLHGWGTEVAIGFDDDGYTGHTDHRAAAAAGMRAAKEAGIPYFAVCLPPDAHRGAFRTHLAGKRKAGGYEDAAECAEPTYRQPVDPATKLAILRSYRSQFDGLDPYAIFPRELADHFLANEYFARKD